jgi:hypothetical protein
MWMTLALLLSIVTCVAPLSSAADENATGGQSSKPEFTQEQIDTWVAEMAPHVEAAAGRKFRNIPTVRLVTLKEMGGLLKDDYDHVATLCGQQRLSDPAPDNLDEMLDIMFAIMETASKLVAKYSITGECIAVCQETTEVVFRKHAVPIAEQSNVLKLVCAHELAHALHFQHAAYDRIIKQLTEHKDALRGYGLVTEAFAIQIHRDVARRIGCDDALHALEESMVNAHVEGLSLKVVMAFAGGINAEGGVDRFWKFLTEPTPELGAQLRAQSLHLGTDQSNRYDKALAKAADAWDLNCGQSIRMDATADKAMQPFKLLDATTQSKIKATIEKVHSLACFMGNLKAANEVYALSIIELKVGATAQAIDRAFPQVRDATSKTMERATGRKLSVAAGSGQTSGGRKYHEYQLTMKFPGAKDFVQTVAWLPRERYVVLWMGVNVPPSRSTVNIVFDAIVNELEAP